jgi:hypothetical protein
VKLATPGRDTVPPDGGMIVPCCGLDDLDDLEALAEALGPFVLWCWQGKHPRYNPCC